LEAVSAAAVGTSFPGYTYSNGVKFVFLLLKK
jgi:hypothetical protein